MAKAAKTSICDHCRQDIIRDCRACWPNQPNHPCLVASLRKFAKIAQQSGLSEDELIEFLKSGLTLSEVFEVIAARLSPQIRA